MGMGWSKEARGLAGYAKEKVEHAREWANDHKLHFAHNCDEVNDNPNHKNSDKLESFASEMEQSGTRFAEAFRGEKDLMEFPARERAEHIEARVEAYGSMDFKDGKERREYAADVAKHDFKHIYTELDKTEHNSSLAYPDDVRKAMKDAKIDAKDTWRGEDGTIYFNFKNQKQLADFNKAYGEPGKAKAITGEDNLAYARQQRDNSDWHDNIRKKVDSCTQDYKNALIDSPNEPEKAVSDMQKAIEDAARYAGLSDQAQASNIAAVHDQEEAGSYRESDKDKPLIGAIAFAVGDKKQATGQEEDSYQESDMEKPLIGAIEFEADDKRQAAGQEAESDKVQAAGQEAETDQIQATGEKAESEPDQAVIGAISYEAEPSAEHSEESKRLQYRNEAMDHAQAITDEASGFFRNRFEQFDMPEADREAVELLSHKLETATASDARETLLEASELRVQGQFNEGDREYNITHREEIERLREESVVIAGAVEYGNETRGLMHSPEGMAGYIPATIEWTEDPPETLADLQAIDHQVQEINSTLNSSIYAGGRGNELQARMFRDIGSELHESLGNAEYYANSATPLSAEQNADYQEYIQHARTAARALQYLAPDGQREGIPERERELAAAP